MGLIQCEKLCGLPTFAGCNVASILAVAAELSGSRLGVGIQLGVYMLRRRRADEPLDTERDHKLANCGRSAAYHAATILSGEPRPK